MALKRVALLGGGDHPGGLVRGQDSEVERVHTCADGRKIELPAGVILDHHPDESDLIAQLISEHRGVFAGSEMDLGFL